MADPAFPAIPVRIVAQSPSQQPDQSIANSEQGEPVPAPAPLPAALAAKDDRFYKPWDKFTVQPPPPKVSKIASLDVDSEGHPGHHPGRDKEGMISSENAITSYEEAARSCKQKVRAIVDEAQRLNQKYYDRTFELPDQDTLWSLNAEPPVSLNSLRGVDTVKRVEDIYEDPKFIIDGATADDVEQGVAGDCWFLAALTALSGTEARKNLSERLLSRLCVDRDEDVGVYGFVFYRDGEWVSEVIDDRLCLEPRDDHESFILNIRGGKGPFDSDLADRIAREMPKEFKEKLRTGSKALYFSRCKDTNETWLPLIEKAYAKAHGDYQAIESGSAGEGIEDLTGGVSILVNSADILNKNRFWDELLSVNDKFLFGCGSRRMRDEEDARPDDDEGFIRSHAYTVLEAREVVHPDPKVNDPKTGKTRLLKIRNPWGNQEWNGAWSDGSKEWNADVMKELEHTFGDDGLFWISYKDFLKYYPRIYRTRLFGPDWTVTQQWTSVNVPFSVDYINTRFSFEVEKEGPVVIVLAQPDSRYYKSLEGRYMFLLHFRLYKEGQETYVCRSKQSTGTLRSCSAELDLQPGKYYVHIKIDHFRDVTKDTPRDVIRKYRQSRREKLLSIGNSFDKSHSKGLLREKENENAERAKKEAKDEKLGTFKKQRNINREVRQRARRRLERARAEAERKKEVKRQKKREERNAKQSTVRIFTPSDSSEETNKNESLQAAATIEGAQAAEETAAQEPTPPADATDAQVASAEPEAEPGVQEAAGDEPTEAAENIQGDVPEAAQVTQAEEEATAPAEVDNEEDAISEISTIADDDFEWDETMDGPPESNSDADESDDDMFADDPWNAVCVVGLRIHAKDQTAKIDVVSHD